MLESPGDSLFSSLTLVGLKLETRKAPWMFWWSTRPQDADRELN
jgi:hypothetical protein